jgi:hypothetical protein
MRGVEPPEAVRPPQSAASAAEGEHESVDGSHGFTNQGPIPPVGGWSEHDRPTASDLAFGGAAPPAAASPVDDDQLQKMTDKQLGEYMWAMKRAGKLDEESKAQSLLLARTGHPLPPKDQDSPEYYEWLFETNHMSRQDLEAQLKQMTSPPPTDPSTQACVVGLQRALAKLTTPKTQEQIEDGMRGVPSSELRQSSASYKDPNDPQVLAINDVLAKRARGELQEPDRWLKDPSAVGSLPDPSMKDDDISTAKGYADMSGNPIYAPDQKPHPDDVLQGGIGDCWMMSTFIALAAARPELITKAIGPRNGDQVTVTLHTPTKDGKTVPTPITIDLDFPVFLNKEKPMLYAHGKNQVLWPAILEKAIASTSDNGYDGLEPVIGNTPNQTERAVARLFAGDTASSETFKLDRPMTEDEIIATLRDKLIAAVRAGDAMTAEFVGGASGHVYGVIGFDESQDQVRLRDPNGGDTESLVKKVPGVVAEGGGVFRVPLRAFIGFRINFHHLGVDSSQSKQEAAPSVKT